MTRYRIEVEASRIVDVVEHPLGFTIYFDDGREPLILTPEERESMGAHIGYTYVVPRNMPGRCFRTAAFEAVAEEVVPVRDSAAGVRSVLIGLTLWCTGAFAYHFAVGFRPWATDFIAGAVAFGVFMAIADRFRE